jgi:REP element-mobilizing transposase RayT
MPKRFLPSLSDVRIHHRGNTPHWELTGATYSITWRLHDSLPPQAVRRLQEEREARLRRAGTALQRLEIQRAWETEIDEVLHRTGSARHLADPRIATLVVSTLQHFGGIRYELLAWCVMPNHVHVVIRVCGDMPLEKIVHSWKSYTANQANKILGRTGTFWQREYYDRIVRDEDDLTRTITYVLENPVKAGLINWPWVGPPNSPLI